MIFALALAGAMQIAWNDSPQQTWSAHVNAAHTEVELTTVFRAKTEHGNWDDEQGHSVPVSDVAARLPGLSTEQLLSEGARVHFQSIHDAGTLDYTGIANAGNAAGTFSIILNPQFAGALQRRGIGVPTADEQRKLALLGADYSYLDQLARAGVERPDVSQFLRLLEHGVSSEYLRALAGLHVTPRSTEDLVRLRDHGVDPEFIKQFQTLGYTETTTELVRLRDHGVSPDYLRALAALHVTPRSPEDLVLLRDHGVDPEFIKQFQTLGYSATATQLVRLRDHGVTAGYVESLRRRGYMAHLSVDELIQLRDHGI